MTAAAETSDYQAGVLRDGNVTFDEYEAAVLAAIACGEARGMELHEGPDYRGYEFVYTMTSKENIGSAWADCQAEFVKDIAAAWMVQNQPPDAVLIDARIAFRECLRDHGLPVERDTPALEIETLMAPGQDTGAAVSACQAAIEQEFEFDVLRYGL